MNFSKNNHLITFDKISISIIIFFAFFVNYFYGNFGVYPIDTFLHYDAGYRVLNGEYPIKDFWAVSGLFVDFLEALFFNLFGVNWQSHIIHSSIINVIMTVSTYLIFRKLKLKNYLALIYSLLFGILAYTPSGTPFVDHHSAFFSLLGVYFFIEGILKNDKKYFILVPWFFGFSFLSKLVPSIYVISSIIFISIFIIFYLRTTRHLKYLFFSSLVFLITFFLIINLLKINFTDFIIQYILYPQSIGSDRFNAIVIKFESFFNQFKYILIPIFLIIYFNFKIIIKKNSIENKKKIIVSLTLILYSISLLIHQILTKNQIFIYFLIPLLFGWLHTYLRNFKFQKIMAFFLVITCVLITTKYHYRYNETRKFHELKGVDFSNAIDANLISKDLSGLKWITPQNKNNPPKEIKEIKKITNFLYKDNRNKILITHYLFYSANLKMELNSPSRTYTLDGASFPVKGNKYFIYYKNFLNKKINEKNIQVIYLLNMDKINIRVVTDYLDKECYKIINKDLFTIFEIQKNC
ncbi:MAG: glycosyltransferase family 39 protein [Pelagibacteraceae bacterium]